MATVARTRGIERRSIDVIPDSERHGHPFSQFTLWCGANLQITAIVDGALAVVFGADPIWAIIGLLIGNLFGGAVMALHSAQGPRLGLPQMISSRAQFGVIGAILPLILVVIMYLGFAATGTVLTGQAINLIIGVDLPWVGIVIFGLLTAITAIVGYRWIHRLGRIASVLGIIGLGWLAIQLFTTFDVAAHVGVKGFDIVSFGLAVALGAGWQLTFGPYVADYSRYLPRSTSTKATFWFTYGGSVIGSMISMTIGALIAAVPSAEGGTAFTKNQVGFVGEIAGGGLLALALYLVIVVGKLTVNTLNAYGGAMTMLTTVSALRKEARISTVARAAYIAAFIAVSVIIAIGASSDFINLFKNFILVLLLVFTPWSAINLIDYYWVSRERVDIPALYDADGRYGAFNWPVLGCYLFGILVQIPFVAQTLYTGPLAELMGGVDVSWIIGLVLTAAVYLPIARAQNRAPAQMIYPAEVNE
ncbi:purine-cytosine permease family protein [Naumannella halotolerans]|uniref:NCS1 family nucleobase:cation symporter-1 n=1 Tax=Naumannella halotolerans TaxID=993414 RepID=A0A4R7J1R3_9ACTN|nr:cytosine permease [Naumannella halotolerans]TDT30955.1 NCS1 family nucleobase:cation symporter-1 [Naumannella halotolerans]